MCRRRLGQVVTFPTISIEEIAILYKMFYPDNFCTDLYPNNSGGVGTFRLSYA